MARKRPDRGEVQTQGPDRVVALDASVLFGAVERGGPRTSRSQDALERSGPFVTTEACLTEAMYLAGSRIGGQGQSRLWRIVRSTNLTLSQTDLALVERLMERYRDVPMDFADATLVALASEDPRVRVATFDSDFVAYRRDDGSPVPLAGDRLLGWE